MSQKILLKIISLYIKYSLYIADPIYFVGDLERPVEYLCIQKDLKTSSVKGVSQKAYYKQNTAKRFPIIERRCPLHKKGVLFT